MSDEKQSLASNSRKLYIRVGDESVEWSLALDAPAMLELLGELADSGLFLGVWAEQIGDLLDKHGRFLLKYKTVADVLADEKTP